MRRHLDEFFAEKEIVELCAERNMRRVVRALAFSAFIVPGIVPVTIHYLIFEWAAHDVRSMILDSDDAQTRARALVPPSYGDRTA